MPGYSFVPDCSLLGAFAKLWEASVSFVMSVHLPVHMEQRGSNWTDFHEFYYSSIFLKSAEKVQVSLKSDKNNRYFTWRPIHIFLSCLASFFLEWKNAVDKTYVCSQKHNYIPYITFTITTVQLHVSAINVSHLQVVHEAPYDKLYLHLSGGTVCGVGWVRTHPTPQTVPPLKCRYSLS